MTGPVAMPPEGNDHDEDDAENLTVTRNLGVAAHELALVFGRKRLGSALCFFGIAFAGLTVGFRDEDPQKFDFPIFITIFGFAALLVMLGVLAAILRKEDSRQDETAPRRESTAAESRAITELAKALSTTNGKVVRSLRDASSLEDLRTRLKAFRGNAQGSDSSLTWLDNKDFVGDLNVVRAALGRGPLGERGPGRG